MPKRVVAQTKVTKNGCIKGRPVNGRGPVNIQPKLRRYLVGEKRPRLIEDPVTGEQVRPAGPPMPIYEVREVRRGRPPVKRSEALLGIVDAVVAFGKAGSAKAEAAASGLKVDTIKRKRRRVRNPKKTEKLSAISSTS